MLSVLLFCMGDQLMDGPQTRIFEAVICYRYYEEIDPTKLLVGREAVGPGAIGGVAEMFCKVDAIQSDLAALRGWQQLFDGMPSLLLAMPMGWVADRFGRRPIILVGAVSLMIRSVWIQFVCWFWQAFDIRWIWLCGLVGGVGGGSTVLTTIVFVMISDITEAEQRANAFLRTGAFVLCATVVMPPLAAVLMGISPWIPTLGGTVLEFLAVVSFGLLPETLRYDHPSMPQRAKPTEPLPAPPPPYETLPAAAVLCDSLGPSYTQSLRRWTRKVSSALAFLTDDWRVPVLLIPFLSHTLVGAIGQLILQYVSKRCQIKLSEAIYLTTIRNIVIVVLLFSILPVISNFIMRKYSLSAQRKDLYLTRASLLILGIGWILVGLAPNIPLVGIALSISSLGYGSWFMLRSFIIGLIPNNRIAVVSSFLSLIDTLGFMAGSPLMAELFSRGLALGGLWIGLPFYSLGVCGVCFAVLTLVVGLRKGEEDKDSHDVDAGQ